MGGLKDLLSLQLEIPLDYMENRIQTIFLDGKAVDNLGGALVRDGPSWPSLRPCRGWLGPLCDEGGLLPPYDERLLFRKAANRFLKKKAGSS